MQKEKKWVIRSVWLAVIVAVMLFDGFYTAHMKKQYPQLQLEREFLYGKNEENLKDFYLEEDGSLVSTSYDPWIECMLPKAMGIRSVEIITDEVSLEGTWAELHFILEDQTWMHESFYMRSGKNNIPTNNGKGYKNVQSIRFDLVSKKGISVKTDEVVINAADSLTRGYHLLSLCIILCIITASILPGRMKKYQKAEFREILPGIFLSIATAFLICVFAPLDLYFNNQDEFWFDIYAMLPLIAMMFFVAALAGSILVLVLFLLHRKLYRRGAAFGLILFVSTYIQGNYLVGSLPPLDGRQFDWADYSVGRWQSVVLWCVAAGIVFLLLKKLSDRKFGSAVKWISCGITAMLMLTLCIECVTTYGYQRKLNADITTQNQFEMSKDKNFIILVLDALDSGMFSEVLEEYPEYEETFEDFTYYPDTMGAYPFTSRSIPYILSGEWFENEQLFSKYHENVYKNTGIFAELEKEDYKLGVYETGMPLTDKSVFRFDNVFERHTKIKSYLEFARLELKLIGFKYAPFDLKKYCVMYTSDFSLLKRESNFEDRTDFSFNNREFYDDILQENVTYTEQKCFKFIHIEGAHPPFRYDSQMNVIEDGSCEQSIQASITIVDKYLKKLKGSGVYDNSVVIIMADHGRVGDHEHGRQNPILLIKGIDEQHKMQVSDAPISYEDLQTAYGRLLDGTTGTRVFDWQKGDRRERRFLWYVYLGEDHMVEYMQTGEASDPDTMYPTGREFNR